MRVEDTKAYNYALDVVKGRIVTGKLIKLACKRFLDDLKRPELEFKVSEYQTAVDFIKMIRHWEGDASGKPFILEPWQHWIVGSIVGFYWKETQTRRFTSSYIEVSRKNGKTALSAALALYFMIADGEDGAEIDIASNCLSQSKIAFNHCQNFARGLDPKGKEIRIMRDTVELPQTHGKIKAFAADSSKLDGFNAYVGIIDEYHEAKDSKVKDVVQSSMTMRSNPHLMVITTAGFNRSGVCYKMRETAVEVLYENKTDDSQFIAIYCMDEGDDWRDERNWLKCTPNLNVTVRLDRMREEVQKAINNPSQEVGVRTKTLNEWVQSSQTWIPDVYINEVTEDIDLSEFKRAPTYVGVDLAAVGDITAVTYMIPTPEKYYLKTLYYVPESALTEHPNKDLYNEWVREGYLTATPGNVTDYDVITTDMLKLRQQGLMIMKIGYDSWNSIGWASDAEQKRLPLEPYSQSIGNYNKPTREFERLVKQQNVAIDNNPITRWMLRNVSLKYDHNDNCKPVKGGGQNNKIDGVISMLTALGVYLETPRRNFRVLAV